MAQPFIVFSSIVPRGLIIKSKQNAFEMRERPEEFHKIFTKIFQTICAFRKNLFLSLLIILGPLPLDDRFRIRDLWLRILGSS